MRLWSVYPGYLDSKGLVALWREALLAKHVLEGKTKGYKHHPQLLRFSVLKDPVAGISQYLSEIHTEAVRRGYHFDSGKIGSFHKKITIAVTQGQIAFEKAHLLNKLHLRDRSLYERLLSAPETALFSIFKRVEGDVEAWEKT